MNILSLYYLYSYSYYYDNLITTNTSYPTLMPSVIKNNITYESTNYPTNEYKNSNITQMPSHPHKIIYTPTSYPTHNITNTPTLISTIPSDILNNGYETNNEKSSANRKLPKLISPMLCFPLLSHFTIRNVFYHLICVFGTVFSNMLL